MHEVTRNRAAFHKSKTGTLESLNPLVSTPGRGFTGIYIYTTQATAESATGWASSSCGRCPCTSHWPFVAFTFVIVCFASSTHFFARFRRAFQPSLSTRCPHCAWRYAFVPVLLCAGSLSYRLPPVRSFCALTMVDIWPPCCSEETQIGLKNPIANRGCTSDCCSSA